MTMLANTVFIDTNILLHANLADSPFQQVAQARLIELKNHGAEIWISRQILKEYLAVLTRPAYMVGGVAVQTLIDDLNYFTYTFQVADDTSLVAQHLVKLLRQITITGRQVYDANIVATMQAHGITQLLTHNVGDFARYAHLITVLPLVIANP